MRKSVSRAHRHHRQTIFESYLSKVSLVDTEGSGCGKKGGENSELHGDIYPIANS
jgi:hypothetical protein